VGKFPFSDDGDPEKTKKMLKGKGSVELRDLDEDCPFLTSMEKMFEYD